jgi:hypothetical protein
MFVQHIWQLHRLPDTIISHHGIQSPSIFQQQPVTRFGIQLSLVTSFYSETDGQIECVNPVLEQYLRASIPHQQDYWSLWLPLAEFTNNNEQSKTTGVTPFFAIYGYHPCLNVDVTEQWD